MGGIGKTPCRTYSEDHSLHFKVGRPIIDTSIYAHHFTGGKQGPRK